MAYIFGFRFLLYKNINILVSSLKHPALTREAEYFPMAHIFAISMNPENFRIRDSYAFCGRCLKEHRLVKSPVPVTHLLGIMEFDQKMKKQYTSRGILAYSIQLVQVLPNQCPRGYPKVYSSLDASQRLVCEPERILSQYFAHQLNTTLEYDSAHFYMDPMYGDMNLGIEPPIAIVPFETTIVNTNMPDYLLEWRIRDNTKLRFFYCRARDERESFNFLFWAVPFDGWGWALLALSLVGLTVVCKGQWLDVFGVLFVRQAALSLNQNKPLIPLLFAAIVITCGYESIFSSHLIVPPPPIVAQNLKELLKSGYSIFPHLTFLLSNKTIYSVLKRENISHSSLTEPPFVTDNYPWPSDFNDNMTHWAIFSTYTITSIVTSPELYANQYEMDLNFPQLGMKCHFVKETKYPTENLITYSGYHVTTFQSFMNSMDESGLMDMLYSFWEYADLLHARILVEKREHAEERAEVPLKLNDPKVISIFVAWAALSLVASIAFMVELVMTRLVILYVILALVPSLLN
jgi:hypothetical protein